MNVLDHEIIGHNSYTNLREKPYSFKFILSKRVKSKTHNSVVVHQRKMPALVALPFPCNNAGHSGIRRVSLDIYSHVLPVVHQQTASQYEDMLFGSQ